MMKILKDYYLESLTALLFLFVVLAAVIVPVLSPAQKVLLIFAFLFTLHEWEENRFPGGFSAIMEGMTGRSFSEDAKKLYHIPVMILLLLIHILPFLFHKVIFLVLIPVFLGVFEGIIHTVGIKLSKAKKFYTPGMVTAHLSLLAAVVSLYYFMSRGMATIKDLALGLICMIVSFAIMQNRVLAINGIKYSDIFAIAKSKLKKQ